MQISRSGFLLSILSGTALSISAPLPLLAFTADRRGLTVRVEDLHYSTFIDHIDTDFRIHRKDAGVVKATLVRCEQLDTAHSGNGESFSITFRCDNSDTLSQDVCKFDHRSIGTFEVCIVPVGSDEKGEYYQAVFNRKQVYF